MIPVLGVPVISRPDLFARMLGSIDVKVSRLVLVDNSPDASMSEVATRAEVGPLSVTVPPANLGVAASWNLIIRSTPDAPWWFLPNADVLFAPGDLARLVAAIPDEPAVVCLTGDGLSAFALNAACVERVGFFDENFHPAYCEDADYEYRCRLAGVPILRLPSGTRHDQSSTIGDPRYGRQNARTYPANVAYYEAKWGGHLRGGERYETPFDRGGSVADWTLDPRRIRDLRWS